MRTPLTSIAFVLLLLGCENPAAFDPEDAVEFIFTGDRGWDGYPSKYSLRYFDVVALDDCKTSLTASPTPLTPGRNVKWTYDWNKVVWKSQRATGSIFVVDCKEACSTADTQPMSHIGIFTAVPAPGESKRDHERKFQTALRALMDECPGV